MGTEARIVAYAPSEDVAICACRKAFARIDDIDSSLSDWRVDSEVALLRAASPGRVYPVGDDLRDALLQAGTVVVETDHAFEFGCGRMTAAWRQSRAEGSDVQDWAGHTETHGPGSERLRLTESGIVFAEPVPWLDFGGIGKGIAADAAMKVLTGAGLSRAVVDLGGDMAIGDPPPGSDGWVVHTSTGHRLILQRCGVATSGSGEQHAGSGGSFASHVLDPRTGRWLDRHPDVTVVAPSAATADALASAACVLGRDGLRAIMTMDGVRVVD